jgi:hypothetical protein
LELSLQGCAGRGVAEVVVPGAKLVRIAGQVIELA